MTEQVNTSDGSRNTCSDVAGGGAGADVAAPSPVAVAHADRDAAADLLSRLRYPTEYCASLRNGESENEAVVAFARHRIAEQGRCAKIADELGGNRVNKGPRSHIKGEETLNAMRVRAQTIAAAIRAAS